MSFAGGARFVACKTHMCVERMPSGTITSLRAQVQNADRVNVFINGEFALGVSLTSITRAGLYVGKQLSDDEYAQLERLESGDKAFQAALQFLEARPRSAADLPCEAPFPLSPASPSPPSPPRRRRSGC